ncbi:MAG: TrmH family RNA methyltransferase [Chlamydiota bacterium]
MMISQKKLLALPLNRRHKKAAELLRSIITAPPKVAAELFYRYRILEKSLTLPPIEKTFEALSNRFHTHLRYAKLSLKEHDFLAFPTQLDALDAPTPFLPIWIYLDQLRSSHNVGSILRTTEAFRLGTVVFSPQMPDKNHPKVQKTAMGAAHYVPTTTLSLADLPRPFIAIETTKNARPYCAFSFPTSPFTLFLGNEEYGLSKEVLSRADQMIGIPLVGCKNSLNVACAFAIIAADIRRTRQPG